MLTGVEHYTKDGIMISWYLSSKDSLVRKVYTRKFIAGRWDEIAWLCPMSRQN